MESLVNKQNKVLFFRVDLHTPQMLIIQFHTKKSLSYNSIHQVYGENAYHTISICGNCMTGIFLMATQKLFQVILKICPKNYSHKVLFEGFLQIRRQPLRRKPFLKEL